jgi:hypothetical protein
MERATSLTRAMSSPCAPSLVVGGRLKDSLRRENELENPTLLSHRGALLESAHS